MKRKIAVGVLGCGYWGPLLVRNFKSLSDCQLKAVCDVNAARLKHLGTLYPDVEGMSDPQQLLNGVKLGRRCHCHTGAAPLFIGQGKPARGQAYVH